MDFICHIDGVEDKFTQFNDLIEHIKQNLAAWNNFDDTTQPRVVVVLKVPNETPTLGVHSGEVVQTEDVFGRR